jgi:hypothetical protein
MSMSYQGAALLHIGGGEPPHPYDQATGRRYDQQWTGQTPIQQLWMGNGPNSRTFSPSGPDRWPGPLNRLPRLFAPSLAALSGARQQGLHQDNPGCVLQPVYAHPERFVMRPAIRATNQQMNAGSAALAVPAVYMPTSAASFYGGKGSY